MSDEERKYRATDAIEIVKFREQTNASLDVLKLGHTLLHDCIDKINRSLDEFKQGLGKRIDEKSAEIKVHDDRLARIETSLGMLVKVTWLIATCSAGIILAAFYKLILK